MLKNTQNRGKIAIIGILLALCIAFPAFSQTHSIGEVKDALDTFAGNLVKTLPFNATMGLNWADAYVGKFPHFGVGASFGFTTMDDSSFNSLLNKFETSLPSALSGFGGFPIPGYTLEGRLGGFVLPFDIGFKFGIMPIKAGNIDRLDYFIIGGDVRYAVLEGNAVLPKVSVGMGYNYLSGGIGQTVGQDINYGYDPDDPSSFITVKAPSISIDWDASTLDFKAQISKSFIIVTPYLGIGASTGWSRTGFGVRTEVIDSNNDLEAAKEILREYGIHDLDQNGFSSTVRSNGWGFRLFGGISFNIAILRLDVTGMYNFRNEYGFTFGARIQI